MPRERLKRIDEEIVKCLRCGNCMAYCPIFKETRDESNVARGKVVLIESWLNGDLDLSKKLKKKFDMCLLCQACSANCPSGVKVHELVLESRIAAAQEKPLPRFLTSIFWLMRHRLLWRSTFRLAGWFYGIPFQRSKQLDGAFLRLPFVYPRSRLLPLIKTRFLMDEYPEVVPPDNGVKPVMRVAYFVGCTSNTIYTDVGRATIDILKKNNIEVVIPRNQGCCGVPPVAYGDIETTRRMARHNIEAFEKLGADYIVTSCASCGGTLKKEYPYVLKDVPGWKERAERFAAKVLDVQEFLVRKTDYRKHIRRHLPDRVTYHDPCHMKRVQEISQEPREVLKAIAGDNFVEMKDADACCGSAGTFSLKHYELSRKINQRKVDNIRQSGAAVVATPCPGCMMHIKNGVHLNGMAVRVTHPILLLAEAYKAADGSPLQASDVRPEEHAEVVC